MTSEALARHHAHLSPAEPGDVLIGSSIGPNGEAVAVWTSLDDVAAARAVKTEPGGPVFPRPFATNPIPVRVTVHNPHLVQRVDIPDMPLAHLRVQPMPDGHVLIVGARAAWRPEGPDKNAIIYNPDGEPVHTACLGDGCAEVYTTTTGDVWVAYFDEGVFGNYGWGGFPGEGPPPIGSPGLIRFNPALEPVWRFPAELDKPWTPIDDCYALNVTDDDTWACYYSHFPVVRVHDGEVSGWRNPGIEGVPALIFDGTHVALVGGWQENRDRVALCRLGEHEALEPATMSRLLLPDGNPRPDRSTIVGRGTDLNIVTDDGHWYRLSMDALTTGASE